MVPRRDHVLPHTSQRVIFGDASLTPSPLSLRVADPTMPVEDRLRALGEATTHHPVDLYNTPAHLALTQFLLHHLGTLNRGTFPVNGTHARTIIGPKGMGKSTVLRQLVRAAEVAFPKVISVYVSYEVPRREELMVTVARHLVDRGVMGSSTLADAIRTDSLDDTVMDALHSQDRRLLLVVDEMDQLYRVDHAKNPQEAYAAFRTLGSLALLGSVGGADSAVLLCGSSAALPLLITARATRDARLREEYPAVVGAPNLNETKFSELRLRAGLPTDLPTARVVCGRIRARDGLPYDDRVARLALFSAGGSPRLLEQGASTGAVPPGDFGHVSAVPTLSGRSSDLHRAITSQLQRENKGMLRSLLDDQGRVDPGLVSTVPWETQLRPVTWEAVKHLWDEVCSASGADDSSSPREHALLSEVLCLVDRGFLTWDASTRNVYPPVASALFFDAGAGTHTVRVFQRFADGAMALLKAAIPAAASSTASATA